MIMVQDLSDVDSSASGSQRAATNRTSGSKGGVSKRPEHSPSSMTGFNTSSDTCQDGELAKTTGASKANRPKLPRPSGAPPQCPRCSADPSNTKFCYYNNYNINQPRYYCKACQRHWTYGGTLRKVETGAGKRNSRRARGSGSICTSEIGAPVQTKYPRHSQDVPHQNWAHENCMQHRAQSMPHAPGCNPSYFENNMADHNSSEANMSFQEGSSWKEGSSFNPDMMMIDEDIDTAQAMADLDVIFANDQLDAILGSTQPIPAEDSSLGTMLGLEVLEDLAHAYPSDQDFQQAMDGIPVPADSSKLLNGGTSGNGTSGNGSMGQSERMVPQPEGPQNPPPVSDVLPSPTVRSPVPSPAPPQGVNVDAAFRNHGRPSTDEPAPAQAMSPANPTAPTAHNQATQSSAADPKSTEPCRPACYSNEPRWETQNASGATTRAPSEEATLANIVDQSGMQSLQSGGSWPEVQMSGAASGSFYAERASSATWTTPGAHMVQGQHGVAVATGGTKYPAVSGSSCSSGMMAVPLGMGNGQTYAMPPGGYQQFMQPGRAQQVQGGYYMPAQPMSSVRFQHTSHVQQPQAMAPGGYYIMQCDPPQNPHGMPGMAASAPQQGQQPVHSPRVMQQQQQSPRAGGGSVQLVSTSMDRSMSPSMHSGSAHGAPQEQARPNQMYAVDHSQQMMLRHQQMYADAPDKGGVATAGTQQMMPAGRFQGAPACTTIVPLAAAHSHSHMYMAPQSDATGGSASGSQAPSDQSRPRVHRTTHAAHARAIGGGCSVSNHVQGSASASSSNPSAASSQSNAVYVDCRQGGVMPGGPQQQPASPAGVQQRQGQSRGPVFCVAQPQWQHAGRPVYTLQQLQHHSAPVCYVQGGYMPGRKHAMYPANSGLRSPRDSTADQGSEEPEQEQHVLDGPQ